MELTYRYKVLILTNVVQYDLKLACGILKMYSLNPQTSTKI